MKLISFLLALAGTLAAAQAASAAEVKLWRLDCGTIKVKDLSSFSDTYQYAGKQRTLTDSCYVIQHDKDYMIWDTGLPAGLLNAPLDAAAPMQPTLAATVPQQLEKIGVKLEAISVVGISHYHFDHIGQAADFPKAKLLMGKLDLEAMKSEPLPFGAVPDLLKPWLKDGGAVEPVSGDKDVFGDGSVTMLTMPGHTPGSYALLVKLAKTGPVLLSGDIVHFEEQLKNEGVPPFNTDRAQSLASMDRLARMAKSLKATLVVQHDAGDIKKLPAFPKAAE
ncbi:N-acyl homoserine lactonase family protein [Dongia rigui]|uniref:N-acyl homoserine lactonase family protein n=1 Tax=Dongia rigui TaxID=940149 RepID=A0ABU5E527_9PROT|nr:N-acyl homoserine lactonase family protein [Dongia rigui]MDY0874325.1 N-acyl homoserine lactonase family protein [Dongia rigui]